MPRKKDRRERQERLFKTLIEIQGCNGRESANRWSADSMLGWSLLQECADGQAGKKSSEEESSQLRRLLQIDKTDVTSHFFKTFFIYFFYQGLIY